MRFFATHMIQDYFTCSKKTIDTIVLHWTSSVTTAKQKNSKRVSYSLSFTVRRNDSFCNNKLKSSVLYPAVVFDAQNGDDLLI